MRVPDNYDLFEMHEREQERRVRRLKRIRELEEMDLEEELGFMTVDEANKKREED
jgi:hypothetical protein